MALVIALPCDVLECVQAPVALPFGVSGGFAQVQ